MPRAARTGGRRGRRPLRSRARRSRRARRPRARPPPPRPCARHAPTPASSSSVVYEPSGRVGARSLIVRQSAGAKHESDRVWQAGPAGRDAQEQRVAVAVVAELLDGERVARGLALPPELLARAAPEPAPRPSRASAARPRRPSTRASARGRSPRPARSPASSGVHRERHAQLAQLAAQRRRAASGSSCRIEASSAACATSSASATCCALPAPPDAITGRSTAAATAAVSSRSYPARVPSASIEVSRISPAPALRASRAQSTARAPVSVVPACERTRPRSASIATTTACEPSRDGELGDELRPLERRRVDRHLVGAGREQLLGVRGRAHAAADGERDRKPLGDRGDELDQRRALLERRLHVEEHELVGALVGVRGAELDRVADVAQPLEAHALDDAPGGDVETRDQARERAPPLEPPRDSARPAAPLFSGWN